MAKPIIEFIRAMVQNKRKRTKQIQPKNLETISPHFSCTKREIYIYIQVEGGIMGLFKSGLLASNGQIKMGRHCSFGIISITKLFRN